MTVCFYCHDSAAPLQVCVCIGCRTKLERAKEDLERLKKDQEYRRNLSYKRLRDIKRKK